MTTYNAAAVANAVIAFKKAITLQMMRALRDNVLAIIEGAPGAPRIDGAQGPAVLTGGIADAAVTEAKLAGSIGHLKLKTTLASASYSFGSGGGSVMVPLGALSFFPTHAGNADSVLIAASSAAPDSPALIISDSGSSSGSVYWRYMLP